MTDDAPQAAPKRAPRRKPARNSTEDKSAFYILATSPQADEQTRVLKQGDTFGVFDHYGDVKQIGLG
jgi:hypothetical protein